MENNLIIFSNSEFGNVRTLSINGEAWFIAADICNALDISDTSSAMRKLDDDEKGKDLIRTPGGLQEMLIVNEFGLYSLVLGSRKTEAKSFKRWITHEVIPSIRKNGGYIQNQENLEENEIIANALVVANKILADREKRLAMANETIASQNQQILEMQPKVSYYDIVLQCKNAIPITMIAKDYGWTANAMNQKLHELGIQFHIRKTWVLYDKFAEQGYTVSKTHWFPDKYGRPASNMVTQWTQKGRLFIYDLLKQNGILPICEMEVAE